MSLHFLLVAMRNKNPILVSIEGQAPGFCLAQPWPRVNQQLEGVHLFLSLPFKSIKEGINSRHFHTLIITVIITSLSINFLDY